MIILLFHSVVLELVKSFIFLAGFASQGGLSSDATLAR
jgi:hypothetical protein